jgi:5-methylthioribose kinase
MTKDQKRELADHIERMVEAFHYFGHDPNDEMIKQAESVIKKLRSSDDDKETT